MFHSKLKGKVRDKRKIVLYLIFKEVYDLNQSNTKDMKVKEVVFVHILPYRIRTIFILIKTFTEIVSKYRKRK